MKIRSGFVSNSSSSSFVVYGTYFDDVSSFVKSVMKNNPDIKKKVEKDFKENGSGEDGEMELDDYLADNPYDILEDIISDNKFEYNIPDGDGGVYIGISPFDIKDDETGKQFKDRVKAELEKLVGKKVKVDAINEVVYS